MKDRQCPICEAKAEITEIEAGGAYLVRCYGDCPSFEVPKGVESRIPEIHGRQPFLSKAMKIFKATYPESIALIRRNPDGYSRDDIQIVQKNDCVTD